MQLLERHTPAAEAPVSGRVFSQTQPTWGQSSAAGVPRLPPFFPPSRPFGRGGARQPFPGAGGPARALPSRRRPLGHPEDCYFFANFANSPALGAARLPARRPRAAPATRLLRLPPLDERVPGELSEPSPPPSLSPGRSCRARHAPPGPTGPACQPGAVLLTAQPRAPTVGSSGRCSCKLRQAREESPRGAQRGGPPPPSAPPQPGARSPPPTVPPFFPQVLKLSLRGDTAAAAALLPLLCLPMDMHCKADPFSAMHREYRRPAPAPARGSPSLPVPSWRGPGSPRAQVPSWRPPWLLLVTPFVLPHFPVFLKPPVSLPSALSLILLLPAFIPP